MGGKVSSPRAASPRGSCSSHRRLRVQAVVSQTDTALSQTRVSPASRKELHRKPIAPYRLATGYRHAEGQLCGGGSAERAVEASREVSGALLKHTEEWAKPVVTLRCGFTHRSARPPESSSSCSWSEQHTEGGLPQHRACFSSPCPRSKAPVVPLAMDRSDYPQRCPPCR